MDAFGHETRCLIYSPVSTRLMYRCLILQECLGEMIRRLTIQDQEPPLLPALDNRTGTGEALKATLRVVHQATAFQHALRPLGMAASDKALYRPRAHAFAEM